MKSRIGAKQEGVVSDSPAPSGLTPEEMVRIVEDSGFDPVQYFQPPGELPSWVHLNNGQREFSFSVHGKAYTNNEAYRINHWQRKARRDAIKEAATEAVREIIPLIPGELPFPYVQIGCQMYYKRRGNFADTDAYAPFLKVVIDTLVKEGVMDDDTPDIVNSVTYLHPVGGNDADFLWVYIAERIRL